MNPGENLTSHLQFSLSEIIRNISKYLKIDSETVAKYIRNEYDDECSDSSLESDVTSFSCYENGQMDELEDLIEARRRRTALSRFYPDLLCSVCRLKSSNSLKF